MTAGDWSYVLCSLFKQDRPPPVTISSLPCSHKTARPLSLYPHYRVHTRPPAPCPYIQIDESTAPIHRTFIRWILILPSSYAFVFQAFLSFRFSGENPLSISLLTHACHIPCPHHVPWLHYPNNLEIFLQTPYIMYCTFTCRSIVQNCKIIPSNLLLLITKHFISWNVPYFQSLGSV
jgi:hypothetical protein